MKKIAFISVVTIAILLTSCDKNQQKEQGVSNLTQDSIRKTDSTFRSMIASLTKASDSLLPYSERKQYLDDLNKYYREMFLESVKEKKRELGYLESDNDHYLEAEIHSSVKSELKESGYGPNYVGKEYQSWVTKNSKNPMRQYFLEDKIRQKEAEYANFKNANSIE